MAADVVTGLLYFEDLEPGLVFSGGAEDVTEAEIMRFGDRYDPQPFHTDPVAARHLLFGGLIASGWLTSALTMRLFVAHGPRVAGGLVGAGCEVAWPRPVRPGDALSVRIEVLERSPSRTTPERGRVAFRITTLNQSDEAVQLMTARLSVPRRSEAAV